MMEHDHMAEWIGEIRRGKALEAIVSAATVVDGNGDVVAMSDAPAEADKDAEAAEAATETAEEE